MENSQGTGNNEQGFAIAGLVVGIIALLLSFIPCLGGTGIILGSVAIVFAAIALSRANTKKAPKSMSIAGLSLGSLAVLIGAVWIVFIIGFQNNFKSNFQHLFEWVGTIDDFEEGYDDAVDADLEDLNSLEELEDALDKLEGVTDETDKEMKNTVNEIQKENPKLIDEAPDELQELQDK